MPQRFQRKRAKGCRLPPGTLCVTRPGRWGNPWVVRRHPVTGSWYACRADRGRFRGPWAARPEWAAARAVLLYERLVRLYRVDLSPLRGRPLACYCPPGSPCHADVLLRLANRER